MNFLSCCKLVRLMPNMHPHTDHIPSHFSSRLNVEDRAIYTNLTMVHRIFNCEVASYLLSIILVDVHRYSTMKSTTDFV